MPLQQPPARAACSPPPHGRETILLANVVVALYFYLRVVKRIYVAEPRVPTPMTVPARLRLTLMAAIVVLIAGGVAPQIFERTTAEVVANLGAAVSR